MRKEYDFTDARPGRFSELGRQQITIRLGSNTLAYFKELAEDVGIPYQTLINLYLTDCAKRKKTLEFREG
ncbi:MAG: BrnA antitoxin family protein [Clostridiales bacterium]|nr:BrnA antitoxin family protein [Clostridiales bacterium]